MQETKTLPIIGCVHLGLGSLAPDLEPGSTRFRGRGGAVPPSVSLEHSRLHAGSRGRAASSPLGWAWGPALRTPSPPGSHEATRGHPGSRRVSRAVVIHSQCPERPSSSLPRRAVSTNGDLGLGGSWRPRQLGSSGPRTSSPLNAAAPRDRAQPLARAAVGRAGLRGCAPGECGAAGRMLLARSRSPSSFPAARWVFVAGQAPRAAVC